MSKGEKKLAGTENTREAGIRRNRRTIIIIASALLSLVLIFGITVGTVVLVRDKSAVVKYEGASADAGVAAYLAATYKSYYIRSVAGASDTEEYWKTEVGAVTQGDVLKESTEEYIRSVVVGAYLFDRYASLTDSERDAIERATEEVLDFKADGDENKFNELASPMGFDYEDFCRATELLYKAKSAKSVVYGDGGAALTNVSDAEVLSLCNTYFIQYSRVKILYIDTKEYVVKGSDGSLEIGENGKYLTQYLSASKLLSRHADITEIRRLIEGARTGVGDEMSPEYFDIMQDKYNISKAYNESGYYFSATSAFSSGFAEDSTEYLPDGAYKAALYKMLNSAVEVSFEMNEGEYREIEGDYGICFIYKCEREEGAFLASGYDVFFHDFYSDAADYLYDESVGALSDDVEVREKYYEIDPVKIPYNYMFVAKIEQ
ncbi:MAG: hypothetical protein IJW48_05740 [Clostridia bacterium]|nr:hypothetical protein [Clostridia bacterium]